LKLYSVCGKYSRKLKTYPENIHPSSMSAKKLFSACTIILGRKSSPTSRKGDKQVQSRDNGHQYSDDEHGLVNIRGSSPLARHSVLTPVVGFQATQESFEAKTESDHVDSVEKGLQKVTEELDLDFAELSHPI
jgi:hypothetical protein